MQTTPYTEAPRDPYDGVPLGVEALVPFPQAWAQAERSPDEDRSATRTDEHNPRDVVLHPGQNLILRRTGVALVEAFDDATVFLEH
jgi:hypothetical protein